MFAWIVLAAMHAYIFADGILSCAHEESSSTSFPPRFLSPPLSSDMFVNKGGVSLQMEADGSVCGRRWNWQQKSNASFR